MILIIGIASLQLVVLLVAAQVVGLGMRSTCQSETEKLLELCGHCIGLAVVLSLVMLLTLSIELWGY